MMRREDKVAIVKGLKTDIDKSQAVFLTNLIGVTSNDAVKIRKGIREAGGKVVVTRNTFFKRAGEGTSVEQLLTELKGTNAVAFAFSDPAAVAKCLHDAGKENKVVELKGGYLDGSELTSEELKQLATLPSRDQMLATLLATFNAPVSAFARVLNAIQEKKEGGDKPAVEAETEDKVEVEASKEENQE